MRSASWPGRWPRQCQGPQETGEEEKRGQDPQTDRTADPAAHGPEESKKQAGRPATRTEITFLGGHYGKQKTDDPQAGRRAGLS